MKREFEKTEEYGNYGGIETYKNISFYIISIIWEKDLNTHLN
jgi:hypothetical protein